MTVEEDDKRFAGLSLSADRNNIQNGTKTFLLPVPSDKEISVTHLPEPSCP